MKTIVNIQALQPAPVAGLWQRAPRNRTFKRHMPGLVEDDPLGWHPSGRPEANIHDCGVIAFSVTAQD